MKNQTVIRMIDGDIQRGSVETIPEGESKKGGVNKDLFCEPRSLDTQFHFESCGETSSRVLEMQSVKAIYVVDDPKLELKHDVRFFDSVPTPTYLWVRVAFPDGETIEGMIANSWAAFNDDLLRLHLPNQPLQQPGVLIPRSAISDLQVITTRS